MSFTHHTWFSKRVDINENNIKHMVINHINQKIVGGDSDMENDYNILMRIINDDIHFDEIKEYYAINVDPSQMLYVKGKGFYTPVDDYCGAFNVKVNPKIRLFSLDETLNFINTIDKPKSGKYSISEQKINKIFKFWNLYPDGMISFS